MANKNATKECSLQSKNGCVIIGLVMNMTFMEDRYTELKESTKSKTYLKTVSAFANYDGGKIYFGVCDDGTVRGIDNAVQERLDIENQINDNIKPRPIYHIEVIDSNILLLEIIGGEDKPYYYNHKAYKRNDTSTVEIERLELQRLILEGQNLNYEQLSSTHDDLSFQYLEDKLQQELKISKVTNDILRTLDLYTSDQTFNKVAELLSDNNSYSGIDIVRFGDNEDEIMERLIIERVSVLKMLDLCMDYYGKHYKYELVQNTTRSIVEKIPEKAFKEAIANALVHRYWDVPTFVQVSMFKEGIKITSPGGLPIGISKDEYLHGQISVPRNPILASLFFRLRYIERFGTGIQRINRMYKDAKNKPRYQVFENTISVYLPIYKDKVQLTEDESYVYQYLVGSQKYSRKELEALTGLNKDRLIRILKSLLIKEVVTKSGTGKNTKYNKKEA